MFLICSSDGYLFLRAFNWEFCFAIYLQEIESQIDIICEMGEVMRKAVNVDSDQYYKIQEKLAQLEVSAKTLWSVGLLKRKMWFFSIQI